MKSLSACIGSVLFALLSLAVVSTAAAQGRPDPVKLMEAQREAMAKLSWMDGTWRGSAWALLPGGEKVTLTQTERVGPMLSGSIRVVEGRGYDKAGKTVFNAMAVLSYNAATSTYHMHSNADGRSGNFVVTPTPDGFVWEIPSGPATVRYTAVVKDGTWQESGEVMMPGKPPLRIFEMTLTRLGDSTWPAAGAVNLN